MTRVFILVEGQTEEEFVSRVLAPFLYESGFVDVRVRILGTARERSRRGGVPGWASARNDIIRRLSEDPGILITTMIDFYGLPDSGSRAWPGRGRAGALPFFHKAAAVEDAILADIRSAVGEGVDPRRFLPNVTMHEFEALLFSDCVRFGNRIGRPELIPHFQAIRDQFDSPEEINDSFSTAPSKRVEGLFPEYKKPLDGVQAANHIGIDTIRSACPHFSDWLERLEMWLHQS